jgi:hypothetical protein
VARAELCPVPRPGSARAKFFQPSNKICHPDRGKIIREGDDLSEWRDLVFRESRITPSRLGSGEVFSAIKQDLSSRP